jgi:hypothetical protein
VAAAALAAVAVAGALSVTDIADRFEDRAQLTKDYDEGVTGRFGNQLRSIPMLIERPNGFGPLRFRLFFGLEPHNSYIGGFANGGWIGGFSFLFLVLAFSWCWRPAISASDYACRHLHSGARRRSSGPLCSSSSFRRSRSTSTIGATSFSCLEWCGASRPRA